MAKKTTPTPPSGDKTHALKFLRPRDTRRAFAQSARYNRAIGILRWALPALVFLGLAVLVIWPMVGAQKLSAVIAENIPNLVIENLQLKGLDAKNQPYSLTAARALQVKDLKNVIELEQPKGDIALSDGAWIAGQAQTGRYDQVKKSLWLGGNVNIHHDGGYEFTTNEAHVDMNENAAWGEKPVLIQGSFGEIRGEGFRVTNKGNTMVITGPAKALLQLQGTKPSDKTGPSKTDSPRSPSKQGKR